MFDYFVHFELILIFSSQDVLTYFGIEAGMQARDFLIILAMIIFCRWGCIFLLQRKLMRHLPGDQKTTARSVIPTEPAEKQPALEMSPVAPNGTEPQQQPLALATGKSESGIL